MNAKDVLSRISKILTFSDSTPIQAKTSDGKILQSSNFDVNDDVLEVTEDGKTAPVADGEYTITFTTPEGNENTQVIDVDGGKIAEISTVSEQADETANAPEKKGEEAMDDEEQAMDDEEDAEDLAEAINLKQVPGLYGSKIGGDNGQQTKSTVAANSGARGMASKPVNFVDGDEAVPTSPKGPSNAYSKGETTVKGAGSFKNVPAQNNADLEKAPAPVKTQASNVNTKSPVSESRKVTKRIVK